MRPAAAPALLVLALLAACGDDDEDTASTTNTEAEAETDEESTGEESQDDEPTDEESHDEGGHDLSTADLEAAVTAAQLEQDDRVEGWSLTETQPPGADDEPDPIDDCFPDGLGDRIDAATVAESEERTYTFQSDDLISPQVASSSKGLDDASLFDELHEALRSEEFSTCIGAAFEREMASNEAQTTLGEIQQSEDVVDPGDDPDLESTALTFPIAIEGEGLSVDVEVTMTFLTTGQLGSSLMAFAPEGEISSDQLAEWGRLLAERLTGA